MISLITVIFNKLRGVKTEKKVRFSQGETGGDEINVFEGKSELEI